MASLGFNQQDGQVLQDLNHVRQSLAKIYSTPIGTRVMRRDFGCELFDLIDRPINDKVLLAAYSAIVFATAKYEPRFEITQCNIVSANAQGQVVIKLLGNYYPKGHLGNREIVYNNISLDIEIGKNS